MALTLTTPLVTTIAAHRTDGVTINFDKNTHYVTIADLDANGNELGERVLTLKIFDDLGNAITPSTWPESNPAATELYDLLSQFLLMGLQDLPGLNGLGAGTISPDTHYT